MAQLELPTELLEDCSSSAVTTPKKKLNER